MTEVAVQHQDHVVEEHRFEGLDSGVESVGVVVAPRGRLSTAILFTISRGRIVEMDVIADPARLRQLHLGVLEA